MTAAAPGPSGCVPRVAPHQDLGRPVRVAVLSNPKGGFNRRRDHIDRARRIVPDFGVPHAEVSAPEAIHAAARAFDDDGVELLVVNGGDGTVQMVLTALFAADRVQPPPLLALLPGGTSNTIPGDVGWSRRPLEGLRAILTAAARGRLDGRIARRPVLRLEAPTLWPTAQCAMQFSAGAVYNAITFAKHEIEARGAYGQTGPAVTLAWFAINLIGGRGPVIFPPMQFSGEVDGRPLAGGERLGIVASTLDHMFVRIHPFWGTEPGRVRLSALAYRPRRLLFALPGALWGRRNRFVTPANGFDSVNGDVFDLEIDAGFTLDGELFEAGAGTRIRLTAPCDASFLVPR